jgi:hypothetical protein
MSTRQFTPVVASALFNKKITIVQLTRCYASGEKLEKGQIEEKVLDILQNFDRVKENPAKPKV